MPIFYQQEIDADTRLAIWKIEEAESFFEVPLQRSITHPHKRLQHLAGRYLLRYLFPDFPLGLILIADTRKPYLENEAFHFSISHCANYAAVVVSRSQRVGIDIEVPTEKVLRIAEKFLNPAEKLELAQWKERSEMEKTTLLWSAKEAVFKWWGSGEVDFSEMILLSGFSGSSSPAISARLVKHRGFELEVQHRQFPGLCLAWVAGH